MATLNNFKTLNEKELATVEGGLGYRWRCSDGTVSAWHMFRGTAQTNADNHEALYPGVVCRVYHD